MGDQLKKKICTRFVLFRYWSLLSCRETETQSVDFVSTDITTEISLNLLVQPNRIARTAARKRALIKKAANDKENTKTKTQKLNNVQSEKANYKPKDEAENRNNMRKEERQEAGTGRTRTRGQNRTEQNRQTDRELTDCIHKAGGDHWTQRSWIQL